MVRAFRDEWVRQLKENDIPEAELSVKYIVEHAMQTVVSGHHKGGLVSSGGSCGHYIITGVCALCIAIITGVLDWLYSAPAR